MLIVDMKRKVEKKRYGEFLFIYVILIEIMLLNIDSDLKTEYCEGRKCVLCLVAAFENEGV